MSFYSFYPPGSAASANASVGTNGATSPSSSTLVAGQTPGGLQKPLQTDASGNLLVSPVSFAAPQHVIVDSSALPTGASTSALQTTANTSLASIDTKLTAPLSVTGPLTDTQLRATAVPVSAAALPLPTGASTSANQATGNTSLASIDTKTPALGQALAAASVPVVLTAAQISTLTPLSSVTVTQATGTNLHVVVDSSALPTGAATSAAQTTAQTSLTTIATNSGTQATSALQTTGNTSLASIATNTGNIPTVGQKTMAASMPVVISSDQSSITASVPGKAVSTAPVYTVYSTTNVTTSAYVQLVASTSAAITHVSIFDSSGQAMILSTGAAASEVIKLYIPPGGGEFDLAIPAGTRISIKALTALANSGFQLLNMLS